MRQNGPQRRGRGRPSGRRGFNNSPNRSYDSSGPDVKIRGTASTVYDKYQALGRDAMLSGDRVAAENFFQHAEHYYRVVQANKQQAGDSEQRDSRGRGQQNRGGRGDEAAVAEGDEQAAATVDEAVVEVTNVAVNANPDNFDAAAEEAIVEETFVQEAIVEDTVVGDARQEEPDEERAAPMNPAELAAMSESGRKARGGNGANGRAGNRRNNDDGDSGEAAEAAPRRQPRRRRRPATDVAAADTDAAATDVVEDVEPS